MKTTHPSITRVVIDMTFDEAVALYKIAMSADHRMLNLEWPEDIDQIDGVAAALQVQLAAVVGP